MLTPAAIWHFIRLLVMSKHKEASIAEICYFFFIFIYFYFFIFFLGGGLVNLLEQVEHPTHYSHVGR